MRGLQAEQKRAREALAGATLLLQQLQLRGDRLAAKRDVIADSVPPEEAYPQQVCDGGIRCHGPLCTLTAP